METARQILIDYLSTQDTKFAHFEADHALFILDAKMYSVRFTASPNELYIEHEGLYVSGLPIALLNRDIELAESTNVQIKLGNNKHSIIFTEHIFLSPAIRIPLCLNFLKNAVFKLRNLLRKHNEGSFYETKHQARQNNDRTEITTTYYGNGHYGNINEENHFDSQLDHVDEEEEPSTFEFKKGTGAGFSTVAGMEELKAQIQRDYIDLLLFDGLAKEYGIAPPNGMLLYGPPGCGKTFIAERTADATFMNYALISPSDLGSSFLHGSEEKIRTLFKEAEEHAPCMLIFDEFDALCPARGTIGTEYQSEEINEFLVHLNNCASKGVYVIAMTNHPDRIDHAVLRKGRMDKCIYVPEPDTNTREKLFELSLKKRPCSQKIDYKRLALLTEHYSCSDIDYIVKEAARKCFEETISGCRKNRKRISQKVLEETIVETLPSISASDLSGYKKTREKLNDRILITKGHRRIGF